MKSMKESAITSFRLSGVAIILCLGLLFHSVSFSAGQDVLAEPEAENTYESPESLKIKVSVNEVRLDAVVLDKKSGNPVTDLTAADFEVFQNGKRQKILSSVYIGDQSNAAAKPSDSRKDARKDARMIPPLPTVELKREDTRRTIIFVVDDISMSFENGVYAKMALRNFVEKQMQPGDLVAILRTGYGNSALNMFLSDKHQLLSRIDALRMEMAIEPNPNDNDMDLFRIYDNQLSNLSYSFRALENMPGRKILVMMTAYTTFVGKNFYDLYNERFIRLANNALRVGVVVNFLNIDGLNRRLVVLPGSGLLVEGADASINLKNMSWAEMRDILEPRMLAEAARSFSMNAFNPLPDKTGGVLIENSNFFLAGIGKETESLMKGYYLISYEPPSNTFNNGDKEIFNKIKINVKRRNAQVYTRDGFYNRLESEIDAGATKQHPLVEAIFSPFQHADLDVNMTSGYVRNANNEYLIGSWIHIDPKNVKIVETEDGGARIDIEIVCLTSDMNGYVQDLKPLTHSYEIGHENRDENIAWIQRHGIKFAMLLPVKKPGSYYVRSAVKDVESGNVGSAYQFIEIPDLKKKGLELSNVFIVSDAEELKWLASAAAAEIKEGLFFPVFRAEETRSPALRTYSHGDRLNALAMLYNADDKAASGSSEIEVQYILYRNGEEFRRFPPALIKPSDAGNAVGIPVLQGFTLGADITPGDYVLQLVATDKKNNKKQEETAIKALGFTVAE